VQERKTTDYNGNIIDEIPKNKKEIKVYGEKWILK